MSAHPSAARDFAIQAQAPSRAPAIEVLEIRPLEGAGNLTAFATVRLGAVVIHSCRVIQQPGQRPWVSLPQQQAKDGKYYPVVVIERRELLEQVRGATLEAWERRG
jgi:DNA-binding cell septation regulator SpoVG